MKVDATVCDELSLFLSAETVKKAGRGAVSRNTNQVVQHRKDQECAPEFESNSTAGELVDVQSLQDSLQRSGPRLIDSQH